MDPGHELRRDTVSQSLLSFRVYLLAADFHSRATPTLPDLYTRQKASKSSNDFHYLGVGRSG